MAQQVRTLVAKPENLSPSPRNHIVERENQFHKVAL